SALPASSITAYRIYRGSSAGSLGRIAEVDGRTTQFNVQNLPRGTHYFAVTAVTTAGAESAFSAIRSKTIPLTGTGRARCRANGGARAGPTNGTGRPRSRVRDAGAARPAAGATARATWSPYTRQIPWRRPCAP